MRITESVLRRLIRETLLREAPGPAGDLPGEPGKSVKNKSVLKQLQKIIHAAETGVYDNATENAWDDFVDKHVEEADLVDATPEQVKEDWASAARKMKLSDNLSNLTFTPDIQGMLSFAEVFDPSDDSTESTGAGEPAEGRPFLPSDSTHSKWPAGVTLSDAKNWTFWIDDIEQDTGDWLDEIGMQQNYDKLGDALSNRKKVEILGVNDDEIDLVPTINAIVIPDIQTLNSIFG